MVYSFLICCLKKLYYLQLGKKYEILIEKKIYLYLIIIVSLPQAVAVEFNSKCHRITHQLV